MGEGRKKQRPKTKKRLWAKPKGQAVGEAQGSRHGQETGQAGQVKAEAVGEAQGSRHGHAQGQDAGRAGGLQGVTSKSVQKSVWGILRKRLGDPPEEKERPPALPAEILGGI